MKLIRNVFALMLLMLTLGTAVTSAQVTGTVMDPEAGEALVGATVVAPDLSIGTVTDYDGTFSLDLPAGNHTVRISFVGYRI